MFQFRRGKIRFKKALMQSLLAALAVVVIFAPIYLLNLGLILSTSIAGTVCLLFAQPNARSATPQNAIFGHLIGILCATACCGILRLLPPASWGIYAGSAAAVGLTIMVMAATGLMHPPAASTALAMMYAYVGGVFLRAGAAVLLSAAALALMQRVVKKHLIDLG